ncbi:MAG TPA: hypothetical protein VEJ18_04295, partial [Planctomycetota bacterium]|nr:hypothetical protein [Planctomycetota bacterium]
MNTLVLVLALQGGPVTGELTSVSDDGKRIRVNLGRDSGLRVQDTLRVYSAPEIVTLPGTGKAAFAVEREVGAAVVVEVLPNELVAQVVGGAEPFSRGFRVVPGKAVRRGALPPHIRERVSLEPAAPVWGRPVAVTIDVEDLDGDFARVECRVDRGLLLDPVSTARKVRWMPPAEAGEARLTVRAFDRAGGSDERTFVLRYDGPSASARPAAFALESVFDTPFVEAADLAGDEDGNVYILDRTLRRVVKWGPSGQRAWVSEPWD